MFSRASRSCAGAAKNCIKKRGARSELLLLLLLLLFFDVLLAVVVVVSQGP